LEDKCFLLIVDYLLAWWFFLDIIDKGYFPIHYQKGVHLRKEA